MPFAVRKNRIGKETYMKETELVERKIVEYFTKDTVFKEITPKEYADFSYPRRIRLMNFTTRLYRVYGFGHLMTMRTDTRFGMQLLTCSFMPSEGKNVPYLLIDIMLMGKKRMIFVEYYDCTKKQAPQPLLDRICRKYAGLPDHMEKPAWYIPERADYSLIKDVPRDLKKTTLAHVAVDSVRAYKAAAFSASSEDNDLSGLIEFRQRMIDEGNPSSAILQKTFGKEGYELFFNSCIMPTDCTE